MQRFRLAPFLLSCALPLLAGLPPLSAATLVELPARERLSLNAGWLFQKDDPADASGALAYANLKPWLLAGSNGFRRTPAQRPAGSPPGEAVAYAQPGFNDRDWRSLNLPHDWGVEGPFDRLYPGETGKLPWWGVAWYRKHLTVPAADQGRRLFLDFDGAMAYASVWCNGHFAGGWPYGYASFRVDLTPFLKFGADNVIAVRLDNPPESSRWYPGGGIYRNVWLVKTAPVHVAQWGTFVTTNGGDVTIATTLRNDSDRRVTCSLTSLIQAAGRLQAQVPPVTVTLEPASEQTVRQSVALARGSAFAHLWSPEDPYLYTLVSQVNIADHLADSFETPFGIRSIQFTPDNGFLLNGRRVLIKGVCDHHDLGALGAAFNVRAAERQLQLLKEMGVNALRTSHNPPAPELLDLCDRMGILVMDEAFDCWRKAKKPNGYNLLFDDWSEADLRAMIRRDRNHPSVILWSTGNEIIEQGTPEGAKIGATLVAIVHEEDTTRPAAIGSNNTNAGFNGFQKVFDVFGYNYRSEHYPKFRQINPALPVIGSETSSAISSRGEYVFPVTNNKAQGKQNFQMSSYDLYAPHWGKIPDEDFKNQTLSPFAAGEFVWTGFDYLGEPTPYSADATNLLNFSDPAEREKMRRELEANGKTPPPSRSSYFGIIDLAGFKKDRFFLYQSQWRSDLPMAHLLPHWNWPERIGQVTPVHLYTSGDEAELFLNGKSLGRKQKKPFEYRLRWDDVIYAPGELKAVVYKNGKPWAEDTVKTTGPAAKLRLQPDRSALNADGSDLAFVTVNVADADGLTVPRAKNLIRFEVTGPAEIIATDNGDATDLNTFSSHERKAFNGLALAIVRTLPGQVGVITVRATADGLAPGETTLRSGNWNSVRLPNDTP
ncbi:MAG: glycoside hydrolase family 2 protein [Verrucomicrobia bacterium]|nr:glycoside hydrolase family 2 protein [Verrucomicrobiota bacterium]